MIFRIKINLKKLRWIPIIWKDQDWDHWYLYKIIQVKLKHMEEYQRKYGISVNNNDYADQMKVCINLLERLIKDDYMENAFKNHDVKWGESSLTFSPLPENDKLSSIGIKREKAITAEEIEQERKEAKRLYKHADKLQQQDLDILFSNMKKQILGWWD
jgi:hypothetical protein